MSGEVWSSVQHPLNRGEASGSFTGIFEKHLYAEPGEGSLRLQEGAAGSLCGQHRLGQPSLTWNSPVPRKPHPPFPGTHLGGGRMRPRVR